ncbi:PIG-L family deacetylase [Sphingomonas sp. 2R-10]|uniref:PIG-L deacetylase family protein n=1 Tax=Sphingomonas sp. 2R-10 TaxID=3045148 RepID=UPI0019D1E03B|nr:PIG-L family deacetylase [Sphingomonas sp. 2R-10]MDJ0275915.1 PIG-L family deacetylase [Sphingomonas sp. 2R-10]
MIRSLLVVAPHPDDETIGAHALMARLRRRGVAVQVVIVSDGAGSHRNSPRWPVQRLVHERQRESRRVLRRIGIGAGEVRFLGLPDGELLAHGPLVRRAIGRQIRRLARPAMVLTPSLQDDHPDHRVVAAAVRRQGGVRRLTYPVWPAGQRLPGARPIRLSGQERLMKCRAIRNYHTQTGRITDDPSGFAMTARQIAAFSRPQEVFAEARA